MRVSSDFGKLIVEIKGSDSFGQASIKCGINKAYLVEMAAGKIPRQEILERFVSGYKPEYSAISKLYEIAGYSIPSQFVEQSSDPVKRVQIALNGIGLDDFAKERIIELIKKHPKKE